MNITLCASCPLGRDGFAVVLAQALTDACIPHNMTVTDCLSGCTRPSALSFRSPDKTAYVFGDLTFEDLPELCTFAELYAASSDGVFADARPLGALRHKALARIPG